MNCYLLVADVLGFSNIVSNLEHGELDKRISTWIGLVEAIKTEAGVDKMQLISDTLFVQEEDSREGLERLLRFSRSLLERGIENSFLIRGAITHGEVTWGVLSYGKPVIEANRIERSLDWIGIACSPDLPGAEALWSWELLCVYPAPKKAGIVQLGPVVVWSVPEPDELLKKFVGGGLYKGCDEIPWKHWSKVERTTLFATYVHHAHQLNLAPGKFTYKTPTHFIGALKQFFVTS